jgi:hypothetical protein
MMTLTITINGNSGRLSKKMTLAKQKITKETDGKELGLAIMISILSMILLDLKILMIRNMKVTILLISNRKSMTIFLTCKREAIRINGKVILFGIMVN